MRTPEIGEGMIVDRTHAREPLIGGIILAKPRNLTGGAYSLTIGIDP